MLLTEICASSNIILLYVLADALHLGGKVMPLVNSAMFLYSTLWIVRSPARIETL
jgi:hypothetical protein